MAAATARKKSATKPVEPEVVEELEDEVEDEELEDLEEDEVAEAKPTTKKSAAAEVTFGIRDLIALIKKETGEETDPRSLRTLIRKMARETDRKGGPRVDREIKPGNRSRYDWAGPNDPEVRAIVDAYKGGELEAEKKAKLAALKEQKAAKTAAKKAEAAEVEDDNDEAEEAPAKPATRSRRKPTAKASARKAAPVVEEVEDDEELDFDEE